MYIQGVDMNQADYDGRTALHLACSELNYEMVEFLLKMNVDRNMEDRWNNTPLDDLYRLRDSNSLETNKLDYKETKALPISSIMSFSAGLAKEVQDQKSSFFSKKDMVANFVGISVAMLIINIP